MLLGFYQRMFTTATVLGDGRRALDDRAGDRADDTDPRNRDEVPE